MWHPRSWLITFVVTSALLLAVVPGINLWLRGTVVLHSTHALTSLDIFMPAVAKMLYRFGLSSSPRQGIIGKDGWLFLGDQYAEAISAKRRAENDEDRSKARRIAGASRAWNDWFHQHEVKNFHVLLCADKDSVYSNELPAWYRLSPDRPVDGLMKLVDPLIYIDSRASLGKNTLHGKTPTYFRTDSHWTSVGAWLAYRDLANAHARAGGDIKWLQDKDVSTPDIAAGKPGDLARLLQLSAYVSEQDAVMSPAEAFTQDREQFDASTAAALASTELLSLSVPANAVRIVSPHALNDARLLWLRDSFGKSLLPYLMSTYREVIELHRTDVTPERFAQLVQRFQPGDVLVSVVERDARSDWFEKPPPASSSKTIYGRPGDALASTPPAIGNTASGNARSITAR